MPGFGGSARLAILNGVFKGIKAGEERKRTNERHKAILAEADQRIKESKGRMQDRITQTRLDEEEADREADEAARKLEQTNERLAQVATLVQEQRPGISPEQALALAESMTPTELSKLGMPEEEPDDAERARTRASNASAAEQEAENRLREEISAVRNDAIGLALRRAYHDGDEHRTRSLVDQALEGGHSMDAIEGYLDGLTPRDKEGEATLTAGQGRAAKAEGTIMVERALSASGGDPVKALSVLVNFADTMTPSPFSQAVIAAALDEIRSRMDDGGAISLQNIRDRNRRD